MGHLNASRAFQESFINGLDARNFNKSLDSDYERNRPNRLETDSHNAMLAFTGYGLLKSLRMSQEPSALVITPVARTTQTWYPSAGIELEIHMDDNETIDRKSPASKWPISHHSCTLGDSEAVQQLKHPLVFFALLIFRVRCKNVSSWVINIFINFRLWACAKCFRTLNVTTGFVQIVIIMMWNNNLQQMQLQHCHVRSYVGDLYYTETLKLCSSQFRMIEQSVEFFWNRFNQKKWFRRSLYLWTVSTDYH